MIKNRWLAIDGFPELRVGQYLVPNFMSNSVALSSGSGHWVLVSPGATLLEDWQQKFGLSMSRLSIVIPNHYHYLGVSEWLKAYPAADLYAARQAIPRLQDKGLTSITALEEECPVLPEAYRFYFPPGHRGADVWLCKSVSEGVWITCDSFLNYERLSNQPIARGLQRFLGAAPGLKISQIIKWLLMTDRKAFRVWALEHLERVPPELLIPSHGEPYADKALALQLEALIKARL